MNRRLTPAIAVVAILMLSFVQAPAAAAGQGNCCEMSCDSEKTASGIRCTITAKGDTDIAALRECVRSCAAKSAKDGVISSFEEIDGGIVVTRTAEAADVIAALHAMADDCAKGNCGCCSKGDCKGCRKGQAASGSCCKKKAEVV